MKLLYISALSSERLIDDIYQKSKTNPGFAVQKFSRLLVKGLIANGVDVVAISNPGITSGIDSRKWINLGQECENGITYKYAPFINVPIIKHLCVFAYVFFYVLVWGITDRSGKAIVCDVLSISACMAALWASKLLGLCSVGVVTDLYGLSAQNSTATGISGKMVGISSWLNKKYISGFSKYVLLTEAMNDIVNPFNRPHVVMEALCDSAVTDEEIKQAIKNRPKTVIYAGGLYAKYGIKMLVDAFVSLERSDAELRIYGSGSYVPELKEVARKHSGVKFMGVAPNNEVLKAEVEATLLVNPRFSTEEFTKYSFPSKNIEYMSTATPLLTTNLPGMPKDYHPHVFLFKDETVEGYASSIKSILDMDEADLKEKGAKAREFVLQNKNYITQSKKVISLIYS